MEEKSLMPPRASDDVARFLHITAMAVAKFPPHDDAVVLANQRFLQPVGIMLIEWLQCLSSEDVLVVEPF